jgi:hypothetical protein
MLEMGHYNKRCPYMPSDFTGFWVNSLVVVNRDQWKSSEFTNLMNGGTNELHPYFVIVGENFH